MKLVTLASGGRDGSLAVVSVDGLRYIEARDIAATMQIALETWTACEPRLRGLAKRLSRGEGDLLGEIAVAAPLPRAWQWLDGSAFLSHGELMQKAFNMPPIETRLPLMYQGVSNPFIGPHDDVHLPSEDDGIDFEGEFGVIVDDVPMGTSAADAMERIRLIVQINDWSLRTLAPVEMKTGFGWVQAKPPCSAAPFAATPDELGAHWRNGRVCLDLLVDWNGRSFGRANGQHMAFGFHELVAHAARTRTLCAGTIIGSGTVSNANFREVGSSCIAERRGIEMADRGEMTTAFMRFGDRVKMVARPPGSAASSPSVFGTIDQQVVAWRRPS